MEMTRKIKSRSGLIDFGVNTDSISIAHYNINTKELTLRDLEGNESKTSMDEFEATAALTEIKEKGSFHKLSENILVNTKDLLTPAEYDSTDGEVTLEFVTRDGMTIGIDMSPEQAIQVIKEKYAFDFLNEKDSLVPE
jgi:hypothetical protein